jgi:TrmH family RNA methyltransferase
LIESLSNEKVKLLRSLLEAKGRRRSGLFLIEGVKLLEEALAAGVEIELILYNGDMLVRTPRGRTLLRTLHRRRLPAYEAVVRVIETLSDTETPQGVVAAVRQMRWSKILERPSVLGLIADGLQDPGNLGTMMRSLLAAGGSALWMTPGTVDVYNPKVVRAAMGAHFRLPFFTETDLAGLSRRFEPESQVLVAEARGGRPYDEVDWCRPSYLIVGNEARGVSRTARSIATGRVSVPMWQDVESLNVAVAASVILFEASRQRRRAWNLPSTTEVKGEEGESREGAGSAEKGGLG